MTTNKEILEYQQDCYRKYFSDIELPTNYTYPDGNPIRPLPPIQTKTAGVMIVGAYPSARFESRMSVDGSNKYRLIPVADNLEPFGYERYFDGIKVRKLESALGLEKYVLSEIGIGFEDCWITDLVKVFLYKKSHKESCGATLPGFKVPVFRDKYHEYAERSLPWLKRECELCKPKIVLTLGQEVAQAISGKLKASADELLNMDVVHPDVIGGYPTLFLPHPESCRRDKKWKCHMCNRLNIVTDYIK